VEREEIASRERVSLAFDDRGRLVVLDGGTLRVWGDAPRCTQSVAEIPLPGARFGFGAIFASSRNGRTMALVRGDQVLLWRSDQPETLAPLTLHPQTTPTKSPLAARDPERSRPGRSNTAIVALAIAPAGDRLYLIEGTRIELGRSVRLTLRAWAVNGSTAQTLLLPDMPLESSVLSLSPDGRMLATVDRAGVVSLVETDRGRVVGRLTPSSESAQPPISALMFSPDGKELAVGDQQGTVALWSLPSAAAPAPLLHLPGQRSSVTALAFDVGGQHLAAASSDRTVDVWDLARVRGALDRVGLGW
jgi:WD40 repeat protein